MIKRLICLVAVALSAVSSFGGLLSQWFADHHDNPLEMITVGDDKDIKIKDITGGYYRFRSANAELVKTEYGWKLVLYEGFIGGNGIHAKGNLIIEIAPGNNVNITPTKKDWAPSLCPYGVISGRYYGINCTKNLLIYGAGSLTIFNLAMGNDGLWGNGIRCTGSELKVAGGCRLRIETAESVAIGGVGGDTESFSGTLSIINAAVETIGFVGTKGAIIIDHSIVNIMSQKNALASWEKISIKDSCCSFIAKKGVALSVRGLLETDGSIIYAYSQNNDCVVSSYDASSKSGYGCVFGKGFYRFATNGGEDYAAIDSDANYDGIIINGAHIETCAPGGIGVSKPLGRITMNSGRLRHRSSMDFKKDFFIGRELLDAYGLLMSWNSVGIELGYSPEKIIGVFLGETLINWLQKQSIDNPKGNSIYSINGLIDLNGGTIISDGTDYGIYKFTTGTHVIKGGSLQGPILPAPVDANGNELACVTNVISNGTAYEQVTSGWTAKLPKGYNTSSLFVDGEKKLYFWVPPDIGFYKPDEWSSPFFVTSDPDGTKPMSRINLGEPVYLKYGFKNLAGHAAMKGFFNSFTLNGKTSFTNRWAYSTLKAGEWGWGGAYWRPTELQNLPQGTYTLKCELDVTDKFKEVDETGNVRTIMFTVGDATPLTHTIAYDANNGVVSPTSRLVADGATFGELPVPTRNGYVFDGWYTSKVGGTKVTSSTIVTSNMTLYAHWKLEVEGKPDFVISSVKLSKSVISLTESVTLTCKIVNKGTRAAPSTSVSAELASGYNEWTPYLLQIGEEHVCTFTVSGKDIGVGSHKFLVKVDNYDFIDELDESNNTYFVSLDVTVPEPDTASKVDWAFKAVYDTEPSAFYLSSSATDQKSCTKFDYGQSIYVQLGFWNSKRVSTTGAIEVRLSLDTGTSSGNWTRPNVWIWYSIQKDKIGVFANESKKISWLQNLKPGNYTLTAILDYNNNWGETNEENNIRSIYFTVGDVAPATHTITFNANKGIVSPTSRLVTDGATLGALPVPKRSGYVFDGWYTAATGGIKVTKATIATKNVTYYAHWTPVGEDYNNVLYAEHSGVIPTGTASVYDGYIYESDVIVGAIQSKVTKPKNGIAKVTTAILINGEKKISIKSAFDVESGILVAYTKDGRELYLELGSNGMTGTFDGYAIDGARNFFSSKDKDEKSAAEEILKPYLGAYSMICDGGILSVNIAKKGKVTVKGTIESNKVSAKAQVLIGEDVLCIPVIYSKKSVNLAFTIWLPIDGGNAEVIGLGENAIIGKAGTLKNGAQFIIDGDIGASIETEDERALELLPNGEIVTVSGSKWLVADGIKPAKVAYKKGEFTITEGRKGAGIANPSGLKLTYKSKDGSFKGSFTAYGIVNGKLKKHKASVEGVLVNGVGYGTITIKRIGTWAVTIK